MGAVVRMQTPTSTAIAAKTPTGDSWIIVELPADATQIEYGAEIYRLVCKAYHGDRGQGLTDDWRAKWDPKDQNCWQSKCQALNHPPDGFYLPPSPAVVGPPLVMFETALDLYNYNHTRMPWHNPGSMLESESWSVTAYILKMNKIDPGPELNAETAAKIYLSGTPSQPAPQPIVVTEVSQEQIHALQNESAGRASPFWVVAIGVVIILVVIGILLLKRRLDR